MSNITTTVDQGMYRSKAGTEIHAVFNGVTFGELNMIKYAIQRDVANVHLMGKVDAVTTAKGKRTTSGACIFAVFEKDRLLEAAQKSQIYLSSHEILNYTRDPGTVLPSFKDGEEALRNGGTLRASNNFNASSEESIFASFGGSATATLSDQIPPFNIVLVGISEVSGHASTMTIHGVQFNSDQGGSSVDDMILERQLTFLAQRVTPWESFDKLAKGVTASL